MNNYLSENDFTIRLLDMCIWVASDKTTKGIEEIRKLPPLEIIEKARPIIFNFDYPIFNIEYKKTLETNFLLYYMMHELGQETYILWHYYLMTEFKIKMPVFNKMYLSTMEEFNILESTNISETADKTNNSNQIAKGTTSTNASSGTDNKNVYSDTPQGKLSGKDYATNLTIQNNTVTSTQDGINDSTNESTGKETNTVTRKGYDGYTPSQLIIQYRETLVNVDLMLFEDLRELFMLIY